MRRALVALAVVAGGALAAVLGAIVVGGSGDPLPQLSDRATVAEATIVPRAHLFGDVVSARAEVVVDRARLDPGALRLEAAFDPYEPVGPVTVERRHVGGLARLRFTVPLRCLGGGCVPSEARRVVAFPPAAIVAGGQRVARFEWPEIEVTSRVAQSGLVDSEAIIQVHWQANMTELPPVTYRVEPTTAVAALSGLAGALAAGALVLVVAALRPAGREGPPLPPLERALVLLDAARAGADDEEQRRALDLVAAELVRSGEPELAATASTLAWSRPSPAPGETAELSEEIVRLVVHGRNGHEGQGEPRGDGTGNEA